MMSLTPVSLNSVAVIGAHCDDIAIGAGATLMEIVRDNRDVVVHALVLSGRSPRPRDTNGAKRGSC